MKVVADKFARRNTRIRRTAVVITVVIKAACKPGRRPLLSLSLLHFLATHAASLPLGSPVEVEPSKCRRPRRCRRRRRRGSTWRGSGGSATTSGAASRTRWRRTYAPGRQLPLSGALLQGRALPHGARAGNRSAGVISFWRFSCCRCSCVNRCVSCPFCVPLCSIRLFLFNLVSTAKE